MGYSEGTITNSYATGPAIGRNYAGGLVGYSEGTITNSYATSTVTCADTAGGLVGYSKGTITNSHATGPVIGIYYIGGLVGYSDGTITNSYYCETTGQSDTGKGEKKTTEEMNLQGRRLNDWDFTAETGTWIICESSNYPILQWQLITLDRAALEIIYADGDSAGSVTRNLTLPTTGVYGTTISWSSNNTSVAANDGMVTRPSHNQGDKTVVLTATITRAGGTAQTKSFTLTVKAQASTGGGRGSGSGTPVQPLAPTLTADSRGNITTAPN